MGNKPKKIPKPSDETFMKLVQIIEDHLRMEGRLSSHRVEVKRLSPSSIEFKDTNWDEPPYQTRRFHISIREML